MAEPITDEDLELLNELGVDAAATPTGGRSAKDQRILAGFEEIERFVEEHGRPPEHGEDRDIFERLFAVRLDRIRASAECREVLRDLDSHGLLGAAIPEPGSQAEAEPDDEELLASLGVGPSPENELTSLVHVRPRDEINAASEVARRVPCKDFAEFKSFFEEVQQQLKTGERRTIKYGGEHADINKDDLFILEGQKLLVADVGDRFVSDYDRPNRRLLVVFDNGTESKPLQRSLQRALYEDKASRRITEPGFGPLFEGDAERHDSLFSEEEGADDLGTGYVYVLRSRSDHPFVSANRSVIHKIGVTGSDVKSRIAKARKDSTYLLADVEIVAAFKLANVNRMKLESLLHRFFECARLNLELKDRFGSQVEPREWFLVPLPAIDEAIQRIKDGSIGGFRYDLESAALVPL
jgi:hypothetical protein